MKRIGLVGLCLALLTGTSLAAQNLDPKVLDLLQNVIQQVKSGELTQAHLEALVRHQNPFEKTTAKTKQSVDGVARFSVDYAQPLSEMIKANGFDWVNNDITEKHFPITKRPNDEVEMKLFHFNRAISSDQAIQEMDKEGYRSAELPEGLAYAKNNPDEQRKYPIVILGSVWQFWDGVRGVPSLWDVSGGRGLDLSWCVDEWDSNYRFLAVRK